MNKTSKISQKSKNGKIPRSLYKLRKLSTIHAKRGNKSLKTKTHVVTSRALKKSRRKLLQSKTNQMSRARTKIRSKLKMKKCKVNRMRSRWKRSRHRDVGSMFSWTKPTALARLEMSNRMQSL